MTRSQTIYYITAVVAIALAAYLYTSDAEAPHSLSDTEPLLQNESEVKVDESIKINPEESKNSPAEQIDTSPVTLSLVNTSWRWLRTESASGTITTVPKGDLPFILRFGASDSIGSKTDCNTLGGSYKTTGNELVFGPLMSTLMFCENSQEAEYTEQLVLVGSYIMADNMLLLTLSDNRVMFFVRTSE